MLTSHIRIDGMRISEAEPPTLLHRRFDIVAELRIDTHGAADVDGHLWADRRASSGFEVVRLVLLVVMVVRESHGEALMVVGGGFGG